MNTLSDYITKEGDVFYLDVSDPEVDLGIEYEHGDTVKWNWEGQRMIGVLWQAGYSIFRIDRVTAVG